ncbi:electron transfer flavoprotein subunit alpha/FixB family protein [Dehalogenimonas sp. THU2]|uniref:electron transfer flavoprotein subunit alpha/FixB family protein n=1 Tax=Dehalogenimonas sp. THU2 TaxID=3151121 RepID=UPI0032181830
MNHNKGILIIIEVKDGTPSSSAAELMGAAQAIDTGSNEGIDILLIGSNVQSAATILGSLGATKVFTAEAGAIMDDTAATIVTRLASDVNPRFILMVENDLGRDLAPLLAARLQTAAVTDIVAVRADGDEIVFTRPVYGGNALADFIIETGPGIASIRPKAFSPATVNENRQAEIIELQPADSTTAIRVLEQIKIKEEGPRLEDAKVVVGGGRGLGGPEGFTQLKELADLLGGGVGASRPPCDQGWWPESGQIGITGKVIAPELYIAVGISGSSQHLSGVSGTKTLVAINKDAEANIFKAAAYGVTGDWKKVLPALIGKVKEMTGK